MTCCRYYQRRTRIEADRASWAWNRSHLTYMYLVTYLTCLPTAVLTCHDRYLHVYRTRRLHTRTSYTIELLYTHTGTHCQTSRLTEMRWPRPAKVRWSSEDRSSLGLTTTKGMQSHPAFRQDLLPGRLTGEACPFSCLLEMFWSGFQSHAW